MKSNKFIFEYGLIDDKDFPDYCKSYFFFNYSSLKLLISLSIFIIFVIENVQLPKTIRKKKSYHFVERATRLGFHILFVKMVKSITAIVPQFNTVLTAITNSNSIVFCWPKVLGSRRRKRFVTSYTAIK